METGNCLSTTTLVKPLEKKLALDSQSYYLSSNYNDLGEAQGSCLININPLKEDYEE